MFHICAAHDRTQVTSLSVIVDGVATMACDRVQQILADSLPAFKSALVLVNPNRSQLAQIP
jgi:hypothetical protein